MSDINEKQPILLICAARLFIAKKENSIPTKISAAEYTRQKETKGLCCRLSEWLYQSLTGYMLKMLHIPKR